MTVIVFEPLLPLANIVALSRLLGWDASVFSYWIFLLVTCAAFANQLRFKIQRSKLSIWLAGYNFMLWIGVYLLCLHIFEHKNSPGVVILAISGLQSMVGITYYLGYTMTSGFDL